MQEFTRAEKREARTERYTREAEKSLAERSATIASIQRDTALAWLDRYYAEAMGVVISEQSRQAQLEIEAAENAYRAGRGNLADILAARSALVLLDDRASEVGRKLSAAKIALARWIGKDADAPLAGKPAMEAIRLDPSTLETDLVHHPELAVFTKKEEVAAAEVRMAQTNKKADWSVALMYSQRGSAYSNMISVNVSVPLQWDQANRQDREVAAKLAMLDQVRAEREDMLRAHTAEVRAMIAEWENDRERRSRYEREVLPLATDRTRATLAAYGGAKASITSSTRRRCTSSNTRCATPISRSSRNTPRSSTTRRSNGVRSGVSWISSRPPPFPSRKSSPLKASSPDSNPERCPTAPSARKRTNRSPSP